MKKINLKDFLKCEIKPFLLGAFLSRIMEYTDRSGEKYFYAYSKFRPSKFVYRDDFDMASYAYELVDELNKRSGFYNWSIHSSSATGVELRFYILNDVNMTKKMFYMTLQHMVMSAMWAIDEDMNDAKRDFIRGFMELRGSVDTTAKFIAQDYFYDDRLELKKAQIFTNHLNVPIKYTNFNARNLQPQYVSGENRRNTQFRLNLYYYASEIGFVNKYKALIFEKAYHATKKKYIDGVTYFQVEMPSARNDDVTFVKYLNFFTNNIYQRELTVEAVKALRKELNFDSSPSVSNRDGSLIALFNRISEDKCAVCGTTTTFENKSTGRQHFEIHHVISYCNNPDLDNIANLVKLCPTCHDMLKKNHAHREPQIKAILKILHEHAEIFEFVSTYLGLDDINELSEKIWSMLG